MDHEITSGWVDVPVVDDEGETSMMPAYLARPAEPGTYANVIVDFEMFGVSGYIRAVVDRIAALGYNTIAAAFYHRLGERIDLPPTVEGRERGLELLQHTDRDGVRNDVRALLGYLGARDGGNDRTAMVGLSVGGHIAYYAATQLALAAVVVFYPGWLTDTGIALSRPEPTLELTAGIATLGTRMLFLVGDGDHLFTAQQRDQIADRLRQDGVDHEMVIYPDTPHGFFCHERDTYRPAAADDAFTRLTAVLAAGLSEPASTSVQQRNRVRRPGSPHPAAALSARRLARRCGCCHHARSTGTSPPSDTSASGRAPCGHRPQVSSRRNQISLMVG